MPKVDEFAITEADREKYPAEFLKDIRRWEAQQFYGARIERLLGSLNETNRARFAALSYAGKCSIIGRLVERGSMI